MFKILICEESLSYLASSLFANYAYEIVNTADEILDATYEKHFDLYLFHLECYSALKELRDMQDTTPCIFIDEYYSIQNLKKALSIGDDYILKPIYGEDLQVRVHYHYSKIYDATNNIIVYKDFYLHTSSGQLFYKKERVKLSPNELKVLTLFFTHKNKPLSKDIIFEELQSSSDGSLRVYISKLNKLGLNISYDRSISSYIFT